MHAPVVATADARARVMVLRAVTRGADSGRLTLRFHTDARSPKVGVVTRDPRIGVLFYDADAKVQIRVRGRGRIERDGPVADAAWEESTNFARRCYLAEAGPGTPADAPTSGLPDWAEGIQPSDSQIAPARQHFAVMLVDLYELDWFYLDNDGHRRARYADGTWTWVVP
ncbi:flavin-binding protein [Aurantiacibacter spongiae]|uniref:Flavin-binding protein n=2 Tax=Aurantiacibacter spongiae TaxID=2488860 RepID=A0A3N5CUD7_9SPHN|nr:flavin-binding protein [Aurantiacibacter spongiae]